MSLSLKYNNEGILTRGVVAGLLNVLDSINYTQIWNNTDVEDVKLKIAYNMSGDERFKQDYYTFYSSTCQLKKIDGNFDVIPRLVLTYKGSQINAQRITSRFVKGRYVKEVDGKLESFVSFLYSIPLSMSFDCEIWVDTQLTSLKIEQAIIEEFYKTKTFYIYYKGMRVGCQVGFPETITNEKNVNYSFESDNKIKLTFQLEVETYQPVFDNTQEMNANSRIKGFAYRLYDSSNNYDGDIEITSPQADIVIPKGIPLWVEWNYTKEEAIINKVDIQYTNYNENERFVIDRFQPNTEYYIWNIPNDFTNFKDPVLIWEETNDIKIIRNPILKVVPDVSTGLISTNSFYIVDQGYFYTNNIDSSINLILEMKDDYNNVVFSGDSSIALNIKDNRLDSTNLVNYLDPCIYFPGYIDYKHINLYVSNSVNNEHFGLIENIKVV